MKMAKKWLITGAVVALLAAAALTVHLWLPPLLAFIDVNSPRIESVTNLTQLGLWVVAGLSLLLALWRRKPLLPRQQFAPGHAATVEGRDLWRRMAVWPPARGAKP